MRIRLTFCSVCGPQRTGRHFPGGLNSWRQKRDEVATLASHWPPRQFLTPRGTVNILGVSWKGPTKARTASKIRKELHEYVVCLCVKIDAEEAQPAKPSRNIDAQRHIHDTAVYATRTTSQC